MLRKIKKRIRFYKATRNFVWKTLTKPANTSFEINRVRVNRFRYVNHVIKSLRRIDGIV